MESTQLPNGLKVFQLNADETSFLYKEIFEGSHYLKHGVKLNEEDVVFDVGANIGLFSVWLNSRFPRVKLYSFEPIPEVFAVLNANMDLLKIPGKAMNCALASRSESRVFTYYPNNSVMSGMFADQSEDKDVTQTFMKNKNPAFAEAMAKNPRFAQHTQQMINHLFEQKSASCQVRTLSSVLRDEKISRIDLLKIDVEKAEHEVLSGIEEQDWPRIRQLVVEIHDFDNRVANITTDLRQRGYTVHAEQDPMMRGTAIYTLYAHQNTQ